MYQGFKGPNPATTITEMDAVQQGTATGETMQQGYEMERTMQLDMQSAFQDVGEISSELSNGPEILTSSRAEMRGPWRGSKKNRP
jgi:hypothetical protein